MQEKDNYYENLKSESYKAMLDSEIQASIARDQAMKYTRNQVNAAGFGGQGMAESSALGIQNNYRQALANAANQYQTDINNINQQQRTEAITNDSDNFKSVSALLSGASNQEMLDKIYNTYKNDSSLNDNSKKQLELLYSMYSTEMANNDVGGAQFDLNSTNATVTNKEGKVVNVDTNAEFSAEKTTLLNAINTNTIPNDSYIHLRTQKGYDLYLRYVNGTLVYTNNAEYDKANNTYYINGYDNIVKGKK